MRRHRMLPRGCIDYACCAQRSDQCKHAASECCLSSRLPSSRASFFVSSWCFLGTFDTPFGVLSVVCLLDRTCASHLPLPQDARRIIETSVGLISAAALCVLFVPCASLRSSRLLDPGTDSSIDPRAPRTESEIAAAVPFSSRKPRFDVS